MEWLKIFTELTPDGDITWWQSLASGLKWTLAVAAIAWIIAFLLGSVLGVMRTTKHRWMVNLGNAYVELFRNVPLLVQFFVWYFVIPGLFPPIKKLVIAMDPTTHQFMTACVCLGLFTAARISEQVRSGIGSLSGGQRNAGYAMGLTETQTYQYVLLPMAYRIILPPLTSESMNLIKNTATAYSIGLVELFFRTREMGEMTFQYFQAFGAATLIYIVIAMTANQVMGLIERVTAVPGYVGGGK